LSTSILENFFFFQIKKKNLNIKCLFKVEYLYFPDEDVLSSVHRFRPKFLATSNGLPSYYDPYEFEHTCLLNCQPDGDRNAHTVEDEHLEPSSGIRKCLAVPFVASNHFQTNDAVEKLATATKEVSSWTVLCTLFLT
jgi:hypothetical protein